MKYDTAIEKKCFFEGVYGIITLEINFRNLTF